MKKLNLSAGELAVLVILFAVLMAWGPVYQKFFAPPPGPARPPIPAAAAVSNAPALPPAAKLHAEPSLTAPAPEPPAAESLPRPEAAERPPLAPERRVVLSNAVAAVTISSRGGAIVEARLWKFRQSLAPKSGPVVLDFSPQPALAMTGIEELGTNEDFAVTVDEPSLTARIEKTLPSGLQFVRTITMTNRYELRVKDVVTNPGAEAAVLPAHGLQVGPMHLQPGATSAGVETLGIDALRTGGGERVRHWANPGTFSKDLRLAALFQEEDRRVGCGMTKPKMKAPLPPRIHELVKGDVDWVAAKDKFFVQILSMEPPAPAYELQAARVVTREDPEDPHTWAGDAVLREVSASLVNGEQRIAPSERWTRQLSYYVGPKEYSTIRPAGNHREQVMEYGWLEPLCWILLYILNAMYWVIPNYGVAIMLLTLLIRVVFWPVTHKSTESMKRMQEIQPKITALREKFKDKPQKLQQETMALYKEHKVNPFGACLPTLIQVPVFIALFVVLRSGVEMRFAPFLWIRDLSEQEGLLAGLLPIPLNILPLLMSATMAWQQKLTPSGGDPQQQKIMMLMPVMMLFFLYTMPSALILYWTFNQCMMIVQLLWQKRKAAAQPAKA